jgi:bacterioferritin
MKGNPDVIKLLNDVLRKELTGINQYFIHSKMCKNWGYEVLAHVHWHESIDEMKHADRLIERILFLEGVPNVAAYDKSLVGNTVQSCALPRRRGLKRRLGFNPRQCQLRGHQR